jgi:hypothetical protein
MKIAAFFLLALICGCDDSNTGSPDLRSVEGEACVHDADCGSQSYVCAYKIADGCAAKGHCAHVATPTCASITFLCGCDGTKVPSGACYYAAGYAGGPTSGASVCTDGGI